jgi:hypothetical protein
VKPVLVLEVVWADEDLLEIAVRAAFDGWCAAERAYVTRDELHAFADQVELVAQGGPSAELQAGQEDLSYARLTVFEYGLARRVGVGIRLGRAPNAVSPGPPTGREFRRSVPTERGTLAAFAGDLRRTVAEESGTAELAVLPAWPS